MTRQTAMSLLIDLRRRERDRVAGIAAQAQRDVDAAASTLKMLGDYRNDYESRSPKAARNPTDTLRVRVHEAFVDKLGRAIGEQDSLLDHLNQRREQQRLALLERQRGLKALETLVSRRESEQLRRQESYEQKQTDEFAAQAYFRTRRTGAKHD